MGLMRSCQEVATSLAGDTENQGRPSLSVRIHLLMCRHCRRYREQLLKIGQAAKNALSGTDDAATGELRQRILGDKGTD